MADVLTIFFILIFPCAFPVPGNNSIRFWITFLIICIDMLKLMKFLSLLYGSSWDSWSTCLKIMILCYFSMHIENIDVLLCKMNSIQIHFYLFALSWHIIWERKFLLDSIDNFYNKEGHIIGVRFKVLGPRLHFTAHSYKS